MTPATPLPWEELPAARSNLVHIEAGDDGLHAAVCSIPKSREQDAAYIVHACNTYPRLVEALRLLVKAEDEYGDGSNVAVNEALEPAERLLRELGEIK